MNEIQVTAETPKSVPLFVPLSKFSFDWNAYIQATKDFTHVTRCVERDKVRVSEDATFLKTLINLKTGSVSFDKSAGLERHLFFSFLIGNVSNFCEHISKFTDLSIDITDFGPVALCSGSLSKWVSFAINYSSLDVSFDIRFLANCVYFYIDRLGMGLLFSRWGRTICGDQTIILTPNSKSI